MLISFFVSALGGVLGTKGIATRSKALLGALGLTTRSKKLLVTQGIATRGSGIATRNKETGSEVGAKGPRRKLPPPRKATRERERERPGT